MNNKTISKDNVGSTTLLAGMFMTITVAMFSGSADAKATVTTSFVSTVPSSAPATTMVARDSIVVTATRFKPVKPVR
ncbi:MAG: hypothetical protein ACKO1K_03140 [Burkholderiales bacterium]